MKKKKKIKKKQRKQGNQFLGRETQNAFRSWRDRDIYCWKFAGNRAAVINGAGVISQRPLKRSLAFALVIIGRRVEAGRFVKSA